MARISRSASAILGLIAAVLFAPTMALATTIIAPPPNPPLTGVGWRVFGLLLAIVVTAALLRRFAPQQRRRVRQSVILFALHLSALGLGVGFATIHWQSYSAQLFWSANLIATFITINLVTVVFFDLLLRIARIRPASIVSDMIIGCAYIIAVIHEMHQAGVNLTGIVTTGAVVSGVLGLSLAPTLGNILGGVALQLDNSVSEGDWIQLDAATQGKIKAIRWRHTVIETRNWDTIIVPNATLLSSSITILGKRTDQPLQRRYWIYFNVDFRYHPSDVTATVTDALQASPMPNVAQEPKPHCVCMDFSRDGRDSFGYYAARYWLTDLAVDDPTNSAVRERIYSGLKRAGIPLALPASAVFVSKDDEDHQHAKDLREHARRCELLAKLELFTAFTDAEREVLARGLIFTPFARNEVITRQGRTAHWLYIVARGEVEVTYTDGDGVSKKVGTIKGPDFFGEMALMTGQPRTATVTALKACDCYRLDKDVFQKILVERNELAHVVSEVLVARRHGLQAVQEDLSAEQANRRMEDARQKILGQIQSFFGLG